jgi:hypothetical protein
MLLEAGITRHCSEAEFGQPYLGAHAAQAPPSSTFLSLLQYRLSSVPSDRGDPVLVHTLQVKQLRL